MKYLKIHTLDRGKWYDKDTILLHAAFQLLVDFVEQEEPEQVCDWQYDELHRDAWREITQLYTWWKQERPDRRDPFDDVARPPEEEYTITDKGRMIFPDEKEYPDYYAALDESAKLEQEWHKEDQKNLHRLIDVRPFLWT